MTLAAEAPDLDVFWGFKGPVYSFAHHRGFTHSFIGLLIVSAVVTGFMYLVWLIRGRKTNISNLPPRWGLLFLFAYIAGLSHILLDFTNNYGVRPFMPFNYRWYSWDIVFIFEPLLWIVLIGGLVMPSLFGLIDTEIGARKKRFRGRGWAIAALIAMVGIWAVRDYEHRKAVNAMAALTYDGQDAIRLSAFPYYLNPFRWAGVVETSNSFQVLPVDSLTGEVDPQNRARVYYKNPETAITLAAKQSRLGRVYLDWAQYPYVEQQPLGPPEHGWLVQFHDLRFAYPDEERMPLGAWVQLDERGHVVDQNFERIRFSNRRDGGASRERSSP